MGSQKPSERRLTQEQGIVLFMVMGTVALLSIVVTEMSYLSSVSKRIAYDALDQVKAYYLAESGLKFSLLRLRAYQSAKKLIATQTQSNPALAAMIPKNLIERLWSFPIRFPLPNIPGMGLAEKGLVDNFQAALGMDSGSFSMTLISESSRLNVNSLLQAYAVTPSPTPSPSATPAASATPFDPQAARESLYQYLYQVLQNKFVEDFEFGADYRDFRLDDWMDALAGWVDRTYQARTRLRTEDPPLKRAPMYSISELTMLPLGLLFDDELYNLFAPHLTASPTAGVNVNTVEQPVLHALFPMMILEELEAFFKFRDDPQNNNQFSDAAKFFSWLQANVRAFRNDAQEVTRIRQALEKRGIGFVTDETVFRLIVTSEFNQAKKTLEAQIILSQPKAPPPPAPGQAPQDTPPDTGIRIPFVRIL